MPKPCVGVSSFRILKANPDSVQTLLQRSAPSATMAAGERPASSASASHIAPRTKMRTSLTISAAARIHDAVQPVCQLPVLRRAIAEVLAPLFEVTKELLYTRCGCKSDEDAPGPAAS